MENTTGQSNCLQAEKKPSGSVRQPAQRIYLRSAILHYLSKADHQADEKESFAKLEIVRELTRRLRKNAGFSVWVPLWFAIACCVLLVLWVAARTRQTYFYSFPDNYLRIIQNLDPCIPDGSCGKRFVLQSVSNGVANPETEMHFSEPQHFEAGMTFSWIRYQNHGGTVVIDGWDVVREKGLPVLAPNCSFDWAHNHIVCEGDKALFE
jgi:hypothetical protein